MTLRAQVPLTRYEFDAIKETFSSRSDRTIEIAFDFFVLGLPSSSIAKRQLCTTKNVRKIIHRFQKHIEEEPANRGKGRPKVSTEEFSAISLWLSSRSEKSVKAASMYFVEGRSVMAISRDLAMTPPGVSQVVSRFSEALDAYRAAIDRTSSNVRAI